MTTTTPDERLAELSAGFSGAILRPGDPGYDDARSVHNGLIDRRPAAIARCRGAADVRDAVRAACELGLEVSVRGGGHNVAGRAVTEGGLMIDLSQMRGVSVDPVTKTARAQGGALWADLNREAAVHGLAVTGGAVSTTGVAGLTLGGGLGWLMGVQGLAADNLIGVELVTADGTVLAVDDERDADLMWALRGGGGNFGVAVSLLFRLRSLTTIVGGLIAHPIDAAGAMLRFYREAVHDCPDELAVFPALIHARDGSAKLAVLLVCHCAPERADVDLVPFLGWGSPVMVHVGPMPYPEMNTILDAGFPRGALNYWLSSFLRGLDDGLIDTLVERFASTPSEMTGVVIEHFHGAVTRVGVSDTAVPHREPGWNLAVVSKWLDPATTDANIAWTRDTMAALREHLAGRRWLNYLADDQGADAVAEAYGPNLPRLREVKRRYDPDNVFHLNHNIAP